MSEHIPEKFDSEEEMAEWFEHADLSQYLLEHASEVSVASHVTLVIEEDFTPGSASAAAGGRLHFVGS